MPSRRTSFPSLGGTTDLTICSCLLHLPVSWVLCKPGCLRSSVGLPYAISFPRWSTSGLPGSWGVLSYLCHAQETPAARHASPFYGAPVLPPLVGPRRPQLQVNFEADSHGFSTRCLRFQIRISLHWQDSLPWGANPYRMGFEPIRLL